MSVDALKLEIINQIMLIKDAHKLQEIEATLKSLRSDEDIIKVLNKPTRKNIDIEVLKQEQGYNPVDKEQLFKKIEALDIQEPLEELLKMI